MDYKTWLLADRGVKDEQTFVSKQNREIIRELLGNVTKEPDSIKKYKRQGNILCPEVILEKVAEPNLRMEPAASRRSSAK
jgi:hypothetical protein